jgi:hypothetical protein
MGVVAPGDDAVAGEGVEGTAGVGDAVSWAGGCVAPGLLVVLQPTTEAAIIRAATSDTLDRGHTVM